MAFFPRVLRNTCSFPLAGLALAASLTACGGGGNVSPTPLQPSSGSVPTSAPSPTPTPNYPSHPSSPGDAFAFSGTLSQSETFAYPSPSPLRPVSEKAAVTQKITVSTATNPFGSGTAQDFHTVESDAYQTQTLSTTTDIYYQSTASIFKLLGYNAVDDIGDTTVYQYTTPQVIDELPEVAGANWTNSPAATVTEQYPSGESASRIIDGAGGYVDNYRILGTDEYPATSATLTAGDDGSASFVIVFHEDGRPGYQPNTDIYDRYILSSPQTQAAGSRAIFYAFQKDTIVAPATPPPLNPTLVNTFPVWYASPFYSESDTDKGVVSIPKSCNAPAAFGSNATQLEQAVTDTDVALGTITVTTTDAYVVAGFGPVCVNIASNVKSYYDYNQDTDVTLQSSNSIVYQGTKALSTTVISELLTLASQAAETQGGARRTMSLSPVSPGAVANARLLVARAVERDRLDRVRRFIQHVYSANKGTR